MANINIGIAHILVVDVKIQKLEKYNEKVTQAFGACRAEQKKKYLKYLVQEVPTQIMSLDGLANVTSEMAKKTFEMFCDIIPE